MLDWHYHYDGKGFTVTREAKDFICGETMDSRDLIERMEEIRNEENPTSDEMEELDAIEALEDCCEDWLYGATFIREDYFEEYAQQLAEDTGSYSPRCDWPLTYIDWTSAAEALSQDYQSVEFMGSSYYVR